MNREELKAAVKATYDKGYHEGFNDACDTFLPALQAAIIGIVNDMKESAKGLEVETFDELELARKKENKNV